VLRLFEAEHLARVHPWFEDFADSSGPDWEGTVRHLLRR
jgi:hypothetical protein